MSRLSSLTSDPIIKEFSQGVAQDNVQPVAEFLAPTVQVPTMVGRYKKYTEKNRFRLPNTLRSLGGRASELKFDVTDDTYNCEPHALDYPVDNLEQMEAEGLTNLLKEGATAVAEVAGLVHEKTVIDAALAAAGAGTAKTWNSSADPIADLDKITLEILRKCAFGSIMNVGVLFGPNAWEIFKNQANVRGRYIVGNSKAGNTQVPTEANANELLLGKPEIRVSFMVHDEAPEGKAASNAFLMTNSILVFARKAAPSRRDPSFMKTFRLMGKWMVPGSYTRDDGRVEVAKFDWSEDVKVTNSGAVERINVTTA